MADDAPMQPQVIVYEKSYRMHPEPEEKFSKTKVEYALKPLLEKELETAEYDPKTAVQLSKDLSAKILEHIKR